MSSYAGRQVSATYGGLLNIDNNNVGLDGTLRNVQDALGHQAPIQFSTAAINITALQYNGKTIQTSGTINIGGNFSTTGTFSSGGNFATASTFSTTGTFSSGGNFATSSTVSITGAFSTAGAFSTVGAYSIALTASNNTAITLPTSGTLSTLAGTETLTNKTITSPKVNQILDTNGNVMEVYTPTSAAVNYFNVTNGATGSGVSIKAAGSDTNINLVVAGQGTGRVDIGGVSSSGVKLVGNQPVLDGNNNKYLSFSATASAVNYLQVQNNSTGNNPWFQAQGSDTNVGVVVSGKGNIGVILNTPSGTQPCQFSTGTYGINHTIPSLTANRAITWPDQPLTMTPVAFVVYNSGVYTGTSAAKITMNTVSVDTGSYWDNTNHRFTPLIAGYYNIVFNASFTSAAAGTGHIYIYKNGSEVARSTMATTNSSSQTQSAYLALPIYFNGSTDYVEAWGDVQNSGSWQIDSGVTKTYFAGTRSGLGI